MEAITRRSALALGVVSVAVPVLCTPTPASAERYRLDLLYLSAQLTQWHTLTGVMMVESRQLIAQ
jgi:hypothetical protein